MMKKLLYTAILTVFSALSIFGQNTAISGKVTDPNGAVISGATVKIINNSGSSKTTITNSNGEFEFPNLRSGNYRLTIDKSGFETLSKEVSSGQIDLNLSLRVGDIGATVNISAETYAVENANAATKLNVPLRDIPQSIQVINQNIL